MQIAIVVSSKAQHCAKVVRIFYLLSGTTQLLSMKKFLVPKSLHLCIVVCPMQTRLTCHRLASRIHRMKQHTSCLRIDGYMGEGDMWPGCVTPFSNGVLKSKVKLYLKLVYCSEVFEQDFSSQDNKRE